MTSDVTSPSRAKTDKASDLVDIIYSLLALVIVVAAAVVFFVYDRTRPVVSFDQSAHMQVSDAAPGEWTQLLVPVVKHRDCVLQPDSRGPIILFEDGTEMASPLWLRDGPLLSPVPGRWQRGAAKFRIPDDAPPGPATIIFEASFQCMLGRVTHRTPPAHFNVLPK